MLPSQCDKLPNMIFFSILFGAEVSGSDGVCTFSGQGWEVMQNEYLP